MEKVNSKLLELKFMTFSIPSSHHDEVTHTYVVAVFVLEVLGLVLLDQGGLPAETCTEHHMNISTHPISFLVCRVSGPVLVLSSNKVVAKRAIGSMSPPTHGNPNDRAAANVDPVPMKGSTTRTRSCITEIES